MPDQTIYQQPRRMGRAGETVVTSTCGHNCGGRCVVNAHVSRRPHRQDLDRSGALAARAAAAACLRPRRRADRARLPSRSAEISDAPRRAARLGPVRAHLVGRGAGSCRAPSCCASAQTHGNAAILDCSRSGNISMLHGFGVAQALLLQVRRLHRAVVEHVGRGRDLRRAHDLRRQGRLQVGRPRAHRLRELEADPDVGLESRRRHVRHRHAAVSQGSEEEGRAHRLRRPAPHAHQRQRSPTSISSSSPRPMPRR